MFSTLFSPFLRKNINQSEEISDDLATNLKKLYVDKELEVPKTFLNVNSRKRSQQVHLLSCGIGVISNLFTGYAQWNLQQIVPVCASLDQLYELMCQVYHSTAVEEYYHTQREILHCDNSYESMSYYSEIISYIAVTFSTGLLAKELLHYYYSENPYHSFKKKLSPHYFSLYKAVEDDILNISDNFDKLSEDKKRSLTKLIDQDDIQKIYLKYFCLCKQGPVVHPIEVLLEGPNKTKRTEIYDAYYFLGYLQTRVSTLREGKPLLSPTGSPILGCRFSAQLNQEHMNYWLKLQKKVNKLSVDQVETKPLALTPT